VCVCVCVCVMHVESTAEVLCPHRAEEDDGSSVVVDQDLILGIKCERDVDRMWQFRHSALIDD
jgi:hypothetical protein